MNLQAAQAMRDGGIDALAALNDLLAEALPHLPEAQREDLTRIAGKAMGLIVTDLINPAVAAFPELEPDRDAWKELARAKALKRAAQMQS